jgi:hypothetical protein
MDIISTGVLRISKILHLVLLTVAYKNQLVAMALLKVKKTVMMAIPTMEIVVVVSVFENQGAQSL